MRVPLMPATPGHAYGPIHPASSYFTFVAALPCCIQHSPPYPAMHMHTPLCFPAPYDSSAGPSVDHLSHSTSASSMLWVVRMMARPGLAALITFHNTRREAGSRP